jgi:hypothetical protein
VVPTTVLSGGIAFDGKSGLFEPAQRSGLSHLRKSRLGNEDSVDQICASSNPLISLAASLDRLRRAA